MLDAIALLSEEAAPVSGIPCRPSGTQFQRSQNKGTMPGKCGEWDEEQAGRRAESWGGFVESIGFSMSSQGHGIVAGTGR